MRAELDAIEEGFLKLPTMAGNGSEAVFVNSGGTALETVDLAASTGATRMGINGGQTSEVTRTLHFWVKMSRRSLDRWLTTAQCDDIYNKTGLLDLSTPLSNAIAAIGSTRGILELPEGVINLVTGVVSSKGSVHMEGAGMEATRLVFSPTANGTLLKVANGASTVDFGSIRNLSLYSADSTYTKTALNVVDITRYEIEDVAILGGVTAAFSNQWSGANSIGLQTNGRDSLAAKNLFISADRPLYIKQNPNSSIDVDHFHFTNFYPIANGHPCIEVEDGVNVTRLIFDGYQPWVGGTYGFYWLDTTTAQVSIGLVIENFGTEQPENTTGYDIYISHNFGLQNALITNGNSTNRRGIYLRKVERATFVNWQYPNATLEAFNADGAGVKALNFINCFVQAGSSATMTALYEKFRLDKDQTSSPIGDTSFWSNADTTTPILAPAIRVTDNSQFDDDTIVKAVAATSTTTVGAKDARLLIQNDSGTVAAGGEVVFLASSDTDIERYAAVGVDIRANTASGATGDIYLANKSLVGDATLVKRLTIQVNGDVILGEKAALATNATAGFAFIGFCAGAPSGVPTGYTGKIAMVYDTSNNKLWFYNGAWKGAVFS